MNLTHQQSLVVQFDIVRCIKLYELEFRLLYALHSIHGNNHAYLQRNRSQFSNQHDYVLWICLHMTEHKLKIGIHVITRQVKFISDPEDALLILESYIDHTR